MDFEDSYLQLHGTPVEENNLERNYHPYDCALINLFCTRWKESGNKPFNTVRAAFPEGKNIARSSFRTLNHIQWAVLTPAESIIGYFRPTQLQ